ncbi:MULTISPECIES: hypothetical protein [Bradyrhizobium]|uniref:hypothetical protein n=1 Tax=Bradyrhizobium TaxID=374 RepID=UPI0015CF730F|nr:MULTISPECIES: hypothetical protein [Bradyrhizobium]
MTDFLLSPEAAKVISGVVAVLALGIFGLRFGLADKTRIDFMHWLRSFVHLSH